MREEFGRVAYETLASIEEILLRHNLDLHAKHWVIHAERGAPHNLRTPHAVAPRPAEPPMRVEGPYDVQFASCDIQGTVRPGIRLLALVSSRNRGWKTWSSTDGGSVFLSYHWLDAGGAMLIEEGIRTALPRAVQPGAECVMSCQIETPRAGGRYTLALDLVDEGVTWFSRAGAPVMKIPITVR